MALAPHIEDKNRDKVLKNIDTLEKKGTDTAKDDLKKLHNIDVDGKKKIVDQDGKPANKKV